LFSPVRRPLSKPLEGAAEKFSYRFGAVGGDGPNRSSFAARPLFSGFNDEYRRISARFGAPAAICLNNKIAIIVPAPANRRRRRREKKAGYKILDRSTAL
jgi:hypothetical protein